MDISYWQQTQPQYQYYSNEFMSELDQPPLLPATAVASAAAAAAAAAPYAPSAVGARGCSSATTTLLNDSSSFGWHGLFMPDQNQGPYYPQYHLDAAATGPASAGAGTDADATAVMEQEEDSYQEHELLLLPSVFNPAPVTGVWYDSPTMESDGGRLPPLMQDDGEEEAIAGLEVSPVLSSAASAGTAGASVAAMAVEEADPLAWLSTIGPSFDEYEGQFHFTTAMTTGMMDSEIEEEVTPTLSLDTSCAALEESLEKERVQIVSPRPKHLTSRAVEMLEALATLDRVAGEDSQEEAVDVDTGDDIGHVSPLDAPFSSPLTLDAALPSAFSPWTPMNTTSSTAMMMQSDSNIDSLEHSPSSLLIPTVPLVPSFAHPLLPLPASTTTTTTSTAKVTTNTYSSSARTKRLCESIKERRRHSRHSSQPFILPPAPASLSTTGVVASDRTIPMGNRQENGSGYPTARRIYHHHHHHYYHHLPLKTHSSRSVDLSAEMRAFIDVDQQQQQPQYY